MKKLFLAVCLCTVLVFVAGPVAAITLGVNDLIGTIDPGSPADVGMELLRTNKLIEFDNKGILDPQSIQYPSENPNKRYVYDVASGTVGPNPLPLATEGTQFAYTNLSFTLSSGYQYLLAKFGNQEAIYWLGGQSGAITLVSPFLAQAGGLSHITVFNEVPQVPEPATMLLLGLGLVGLAGFRRKIK